MATNNVTVRRLAPDEVPGVKGLLDRCFGEGFEDIDETDTAFAADVDGRLAGVVAAALRRPEDLEPHYAGRVSWPGDSQAQYDVALIRQIAVERSARGLGIGDALMAAAEDAVAERSAERGAERGRFLLANAWVHANTGHCPAAPLLERRGFAAAGWIPDFFVAMPCENCPGCGTTPCRCSVRVYFKEPVAQRPM